MLKKIQKSNVDRNIEVLSKIAQVTSKIVENKEQTINDNSFRKETILANVSNEIENLKSKLDEWQQQFEKTFLRLHEENEKEQTQCVLDLKQCLLTVRNGESLLSAVQQKGSAKQTFIAAMKIIADVEEQFEQFNDNYSEDEVIRYEHDHTTILKQLCEHGEIEAVKKVTRPSGTIWNVSMLWQSVGVVEIREQKQQPLLYQNVTDLSSLKGTAEKTSEFQISISGSAHQGVFVDSETVVIACSFPACLRVLNLNGTEISFHLPIELKGRPSLYVSFTKNLLYVGCLSSVYKLKIRNNKMNAFTATCMAKIDLKEDFDLFWVDEEKNRIVVATQDKISIFTLSPIYNVQTTLIKSSITSGLPSICIRQDRLACISAKEVLCFSLSGQQLFQSQIPKVHSIRCLTIDPLNNVYGGCTWRQGCSRYNDKFHLSKCNTCFHYLPDHKDVDGVFQILSDGIIGRLFITDYPNVQFLFFDEYSEQFVVSDGKKCTVYRLCLFSDSTI